MWRLFPRINKIGFNSGRYYKYLTRENSLMTSQNQQRILNLLSIFNTTLQQLVSEKYISDTLRLDIDSRVKFALIHSLAKNSSYDMYLKFIEEIDYKELLKHLYKFPDYRIKILSRILLINPILFYKLCKI